MLNNVETDVAACWTVSLLIFGGSDRPKQQKKVHARFNLTRKIPPTISRSINELFLCCFINAEASCGCRAWGAMWNHLQRVQLEVIGRMHPIYHYSLNAFNYTITFKGMRNIDTHSKVRSKHMGGLHNIHTVTDPQVNVNTQKLGMSKIYSERQAKKLQMFTVHTSPHLPWITQANTGMAHHLFLEKSRVGHRRRDDFRWHRDVQQRRPETHVFTQVVSMVGRRVEGGCRLDVGTRSY